MSLNTQIVFDKLTKYAVLVEIQNQDIKISSFLHFSMQGFMWILIRKKIQIRTQQLHAHAVLKI